MDYCNDLYSGLLKKRISQLLQNFTARMLIKTRKRAHLIPSLIPLHWHFNFISIINFKFLSTLWYRLVYEMCSMNKVWMIDPWINGYAQDRDSEAQVAVNGNRCDEETTQGFPLGDQGVNHIVNQNESSLYCCNQSNWVCHMSLSDIKQAVTLLSLWGIKEMPRALSSKEIIDVLMVKLQSEEQSHFQDYFCINLFHEITHEITWASFRYDVVFISAFWNRDVTVIKWHSAKVCHSLLNWKLKNSGWLLLWSRKRINLFLIMKSVRVTCYLHIYPFSNTLCGEVACSSHFWFVKFEELY